MVPEYAAGSPALCASSNTHSCAGHYRIRDVAKGDPHRTNTRINWKPNERSATQGGALAPLRLWLRAADKIHLAIAWREFEFGERLSTERDLARYFAFSAT